MSKESIQTQRAPAAIGPYSQGIRLSEWVFTAGQVGADPATGDLGDGVEAQARQALTNIESVLAAADCRWDHVVKTTIFLKDMSDFAAFNAVYEEIVTKPYPARSTVAVAGLPKGAKVEIEAIAFRG